MIKLAIAQRGRRVRKAPEAHFVCTADFSSGRLTRKAGEALCTVTPDRWLDILPAGVRVCETCMDRAVRYDIEVPEHDLKSDYRLPTSAYLFPDDPPVRYVRASKWRRYDRWLPYRGYLRRWDWIRNHCACAHCGQPITSLMAGDPVLGMSEYNYFICQNSHDIKDERDLIDQAQAASDPEAIQVTGYQWLVAGDEDDPPF